MSPRLEVQAETEVARAQRIIQVMDQTIVELRGTLGKMRFENAQLKSKLATLQRTLGRSP